MLSQSRFLTSRAKSTQIKIGFILYTNIRLRLVLQLCFVFEPVFWLC